MSFIYDEPNSFTSLGDFIYCSYKSKILKDIVGVDFSFKNVSILKELVSIGLFYFVVFIFNSF